jgi:hypothetical protein
VLESRFAQDDCWIVTFFISRFAHETSLVASHCPLRVCIIGTEGELSQLFRTKHIVIANNASENAPNNVSYRFCEVLVVDCITGIINLDSRSERPALPTTRRRGRQRWRGVIFTRSSEEARETYNNDGEGGAIYLPLLGQRLPVYKHLSIPW